MTPVMVAMPFVKNEFLGWIMFVIFYVGWFITLYGFYLFDKKTIGVKK
jgi:hypothetical protein